MWFTIENIGIILGQREIVNQLSFSLEKGEIACLLGPSGCGKTTVLRSIAGFESIHHGNIALDHQVLAGDQQHLPAHMRQVGMIFQDYALFPHLTVAANIAFGLRGMNKAAQKTRIDELLTLINLEGYGDYYPHQLSGGQQQRVAIARALAPKPKLLLLDEPFSNLDADLRANLAYEIRQLLKQEAITAILVTHDQHEAFAFADKIGLLSEGTLQQWDTPHNLYHSPINTMVASFLGKGQWIDAVIYDATTLKSALGNHAYSATPDMQIGAEVKLLVRSHELSYNDLIPANGTVLQTVFQGEYIRHYIQLDNGENLIADWHTTQHGRIGIFLNTPNIVIF